MVVDHQAIIINDFVEPLDLFLKIRRFTLKDSSLVLNDLKEKTDIQDDEYILLAGDAYTEYKKIIKTYI